MIKLPVDKYGNRGWIVKARLRRWCSSRGGSCQGAIRPGDYYYRCVAFPDGDVNTGKQPWVMSICPDCLHDEMRAAFDALIPQTPAPAPSLPAPEPEEKQ